jgi:dimethylargininase
VKAIEVRGCLHLKTACTYLGRDTVLINRRWVDARAFSAFEALDIPVDEPWGANTLRIGEKILLPSRFPATRALLAANGFATQLIDISELQKAEAGLTCLSIIFESTSDFPNLFAGF